MAIDPDVQPLLDTINTRLDALEAGGGGGNSLTDDAWLRFTNRVSAQLLPLDDAGRAAFLDSLAP